MPLWHPACALRHEEYSNRGQSRGVRRGEGSRAGSCSPRQLIGDSKNSAPLLGGLGLHCEATNQLEGVTNAVAPQLPHQRYYRVSGAIGTVLLSSSMSSPMTPIIFVNIGWMERYEGISEDDEISGGFGYFREHKFGHEAWNFAPLRGRLYGYVPRSQRINLERLGAGSRDAEVGGVTVVWIARDPSINVIKIVGWYLGATIRSDHRAITRAGGHEVHYQIDAPANLAVRLKGDQRLFKIPTAQSSGKGNLGQSPVWYGGSEAFRNDVLKYVAVGGVLSTPASKSKLPPKNFDPEARKRIELAAVAHATRYYKSIEGGGRAVKSVERDNCGWDLTVTAPNGEVLKVEVKGLTGAECIVELTPNEYKMMRSVEHRDQYVIYIVTQADTYNARSHVFRYLRDESTLKDPIWASSDGRRLRIKPMTAAHLSVA